MRANGDLVRNNPDQTIWGSALTARTVPAPSRSALNTC